MEVAHHRRRVVVSSLAAPRCLQEVTGSPGGGFQQANWPPAGRHDKTAAVRLYSRHRRCTRLTGPSVTLNLDSWVCEAYPAAADRAARTDWGGGVAQDGKACPRRRALREPVGQEQMQSERDGMGPSARRQAG
ncbi:hypothetical protein GGTG_09846 [Gaeumannomyces tritici R3-111a-1]|uniref:Uncharacterized protein n=1 Tax=Gaeumannomyces tritici (strain R3-111a-1) TaxID=644352 RepID=J3P8L2_GAET3|nr:hypothetical protein GGTG_09846 [Gaeumannomyces tritici R3-111a-1]EJT72995.1 hypothetical protein GGTG_09846 [Gaeumannomyces tritici R3-111a-1]